MNILVTGGAGYIGGELVYRLSQFQNVDNIIVYDNLSRGNHNLFISFSNRIKENKVHFVHGELLDSRKLRQVIQDVDMVYHLAASMAPPFSDIDPHCFEQTNHWGTAELVYAAEESERVSRFIYLSSASVYGSPHIPADEDTSPNPLHFYSVSKLRGEEHVRRLMEKKNTAILRSGSVYGYSPGIRFDSGINRFLFDAHFNNQISIHGSGKQIRTFIHINKLVDALLTPFLKDVPNGVYNITERNLSVLEIVDVLKEIYPELEFIFINQHLSMQNLQVETHTRFSQYYQFPITDFHQELIDFKERFAFSSL